MNILIGYESSGIIRDRFIEAGHNAWSCDLLPGEGVNVHRHIQDDIHNMFRSWTAPDGTIEHFGYRLKGALIYPEFWDLAIFHPDCTYLTNSAAWAFKDGPHHQKVKPGTLVGAERREARILALDEVRWLMGLPIERVCIENPPGAIGTNIKKASQYIQPYEFGDNASKKTGLWLKNLPALVPTDYIEPRMVCDCGRVYSPEYFHGKHKKACVVCVVNGKDPNRPKPRWANQTDSGQNRLSPSADRWQKRAETYPGIADAMVKQWSTLL